MNFQKNIAKSICVSGLLHDTGKYLQKCGNAKVKHNILSQLFVLANPSVCAGADVTMVANLIAHHHDDVSTLSSEVVFGPGEYADISVIKLASENYDIHDYDEYVSLLRKADSLAASSDRASEIESGKKGGRAPYAPLISVVGRTFDKRIAIRHGSKYETYVYNGNDETEVTVEANDNNFKQHISESFKDFMKDSKSISSLDDLADVLKTHWSTVNANTWKPEGETLGNTATSLFDHDKMTGAIVLCLYINACYGFDGIDIWHVVYNGNNDSLISLIESKFEELGLYSPNIIYCTSGDGFFMLPSAYRDEFKKFLADLNHNSFVSFGETIDYSIAEDWIFKDCRDDITTRFSEKYIGILDVLSERIQDPVDVEYLHKHYKNKIIAGYAINNYDAIVSDVLSNNDSISKLSTLFRLFENFSNDVCDYLNSEHVEIMSQTLSECIYVCDENNLRKIERKISALYDAYVCSVTGLTFAHKDYNRYENTVECVKNMLQVRLMSFKSLEDGISTTVLIHGMRYKLKSLDTYDRVYKSASHCINAVLYKILRLYDEAFLYKKDKNPSHLVALSRFEYLIRNTVDETDKAFLKECKEHLYDREKESIRPVADIYYEAVHDAVRREK